MTEVNPISATTISATVPLSTPLSTDEIRDAVSQTLGALRGEPVAAEALKNEKPSEAQLFFALSYAYMKREAPQNAAAMLIDIPKLKRNLQKSKDQNPIYTAVSAFLEKTAKETILSKNEIKLIRRLSVGTAQMDSARTALSTKRVLPNGVEKAATNLETISHKIGTNKKATAGEIATLEERLKKERLEAGARTGNILERYMKKALPIAPTISVPAATTPVTSLPTTPTSTTIGTPEEITTPATVNPEDRATGPQDAVYKPRSKSDGNAWYYVPAHLSERVGKIFLIKPKSNSVDETELIEELEIKGKISDGRLVFSSNKEGSKIAPEMMVRYGYRDGSIIDVKLLKGDEYWDSNM